MVDSYFDRLAPTLLAALALLGAYHHQLSLVALATTLLFTLLVTRFWSHHSLEAIEYRRATNDDRAFPGDELLLTLRLTNDKLLPLPWVEVDDRIPWQLAPVPDGSEPADGAQKGLLRLGGSVGWKERIRWRYRLRCQWRGIYPLGPATVTSGDPFGLFPRSSTVGESERVVVYPQLLPLDRLGLPPGFPLGERKPERWIFEDPSRPTGVRDYRREDPFHHIHWKATARRQQLQVKLHEPTTTIQTAIFLGVDTFEDREMGRHGDTGTRGRGDAGTQNPEPRTQNPSALSTQHSAFGGQHPAPAFEYAVSVAATLAHGLIGQRHPVGLYVNGGTAGTRDPVDLAPGASQEQLIQILELLAGVEPVASGPVELLLAEVAPRLPWGASVILVVGELSESLAAALHGLGRTGRKPTVLLIGKKPLPQGFEGVTMYPLQPALPEEAVPSDLDTAETRG